jgi:hypothetical protein
MKTITIIIILLSTTFLYGQSIDISILNFKDEYKGDEPSWYTCNKDSLIYKADTLVFTTKSYGCCDYFSLTIRKKKIFNIHTGQVCSEPPTMTLTKKIKTGKVKKKDSDYFLIIYDEGKLKSKFKIIELTIKHFTDNGGYPRDYYSMTVVKI